MYNTGNDSSQNTKSIKFTNQIKEVNKRESPNITAGL